MSGSPSSGCGNMIELRGVSYVYPTATRPTLNDVNLSIREGEWLLLAGPSGCGKSTLLYLLNGLIPHVVAGELQGEVRVDGLAPGDVPLAEVSRRVGTVFQNPEVQLFMLRVAEDVAFGCENLGLPPAETLRRVDRALGQMSLSPLRDHETFRLSGGQKQRLAIAGALAMGSRTLLLDEPTSDLDSGSRSELLAALQELHRAGHTIVMTEHRLEGLQGLVDRVITLDDGRIVTDGPFPEIAAPARIAKEPIARSGAIVECEHLTFSYPGSSPVLCDVSFQLQAGRCGRVDGLQWGRQDDLAQTALRPAAANWRSVDDRGAIAATRAGPGRHRRFPVPESRRTTLYGKRRGRDRVWADEPGAAGGDRLTARTDRLVTTTAKPIRGASRGASGSFWPPLRCWR